jgi:hypothetical protein
MIMAGQSNALNWHAAAARLPPDPADARVLFYFETGAPPSRQATPAINSTSAGQWTVLQPQHQNPFVKYERDFFGPEITLARRLQVAANEPLAVIKVAYFGTNLVRDWAPDARDGDRLYARLQQHVADALRLLRERGDNPRVVGFFWMQGETDGATAQSAADYETNLRNFILRVRTDLHDPKLPFILGRVGPRPPKGYVHQEIVRTAQVRVAESLALTAWVDTDDLGRDTDGVHLLAPGVMALGERMAAAWIRLGKIPSP